MQYKHFTPLMLALALADPMRAAELGDIAPRSYIGQPLAVDIDLVSLTPEEANGLQVRLAAPDVYRGANAAMNPALASVRMQVERRGGKPVLHVTTTRPVEAEYLHLYVELGVPGKSDVRLATVWLQPDPNPAPPPAPAAPAAPPVPLASAMTPAQAEQIAAQARAARAAAGAKPAVGSPAAAPAAGGKPAAGATTVAAGASGAAAMAAPSGSAGDAGPVRDRSKPAPLPSLHEAETGKPGEVREAARRIAGVLVSADGKPVKPSAREEAGEVPVSVAQALLPLGPLPLPKGVKRPAPASCAPTGMSAKECVALDQHNAELSGKLTELESKLKALQGAFGGAAPVVAAAKNGAASAPAPAGHGEAAAAKPATTPAASASAAAKAATPASAAASAGGAGSGAGAASASGAGHGAAASASAGATVGHAAPGGVSAGDGGHGGATAGDGGRGAAAGGKGAASSMASASMSAQGETEAHAARAAGAEAPASASAAASAASASVPTKQVRVLPKLKYKKEKEKEKPSESSGALPLIAGGAGLLALLGGGLVFWRKKNAGRGPLKIWQGFRKKKAGEPVQEFVPVPDPATESTAS